MIIIIYLFVTIITAFWMMYLDRTGEPLLAIDSKDVYDDIPLYFITGAAWFFFIPVCIVRTVSRMVNRRHRLKKLVVTLVEMLILFFHKDKEE